MPNVVSPKFFKSKTIFTKLEATYGTLEALVAADWTEARNVTFTPFEASVVDRNIVLDGKGRTSGLVGSVNAKLSFDIALAPSGIAGQAPKWGRHLRGCGFAETVVANTSVTYSLVSSNEESLSLVFFDALDKHVLSGARGTVAFKLDGGGVPLMSFTFTGLYTDPVAATGANAKPVIDKVGWATEQLVDSRYTTGKLNAGVDVPVAFKSASIDIAHMVEFHDYPGPFQEVGIKDRAPTVQLQYVNPGLAAFNPFALATSATSITATVVHGTGAGKVATFVARGKITSPNKVDIDGFAGIDLQIQPEATAAGNDEVVLTLT